MNSLLRKVAFPSTTRFMSTITKRLDGKVAIVTASTAG